MSNELKMGESLQIGEQLTSSNGLFNVKFQTDYNFVLRLVGDHVLWATDKYQSAGQTKGSISLQTDGNLVVRDATGNPIWASNTSTTLADTKLIMQDDGNLVIYSGGKSIWATNTYCSIQINGTLKNVVYGNVTKQAVKTLESYDNEVVNNNSKDQTSTVAISINYTDTRTFEQNVGVSIGASATLEAGIPSIGKASVTVSTELTFGVTWGEQHSISKSVTGSVQADVPANSKMGVQTDVTQIYFEVEYTCDCPYKITTGYGTSFFNKGTEFQVTANLNGKFKGGSGYTLNSTYGKAIPIT